MTEYLSAAETAKVVRKLLKTAFPGIKFSVRSETYSMGSSVRVSWTDGPTTGQVDHVVGFLAGSEFDGMIDLKINVTFALHCIPIYHIRSISCMYLGILGTLAVNRSMPILYGSARLLPERERLKHDLKPSLADLRPTFPQDGDLCDSSAHVGWPGGPGRSLILKQICSGLLKAPLLKGRGSLPTGSCLMDRLLPHSVLDSSGQIINTGEVA